MPPSSRTSPCPTTARPLSSPGTCSIVRAGQVSWDSRHGSTIERAGQGSSTTTVPAGSPPLRGVADRTSCAMRTAGGGASCAQGATTTRSFSCPTWTRDCRTGVSVRKDGVCRAVTGIDLGRGYPIGTASRGANEFIEGCGAHRAAGRCPSAQGSQHDSSYLTSNTSPRPSRQPRTSQNMSIQ